MYENLERIKQLIDDSGNKYDFEKIERAYVYAKHLHEGQFRVSGEPYISHPIAVAEIVAGLELDTDSICAALLHDTVEDCSEQTNLKEIEKKFGETVALLVDGLTKIVTLKVDDKSVGLFCLVAHVTKERENVALFNIALGNKLVKSRF